MSSREQSTTVRRSIKSVRERAVFIALACVAVLGIGAISFLPVGDKRLLHTNGKYHSWGHFIAFSFVAFVTGRASRTVRGRVFLFLGSLLFGLGIEVGEHLAFGSLLEWMDVLVDAAGVVGGTLLAILSAPKVAE